MCDFSLMHAKSRKAEVADKLQTRDFGRGTIGFASESESNNEVDNTTAVCVLPGTEIAFDEVPTLRWGYDKVPTDKVAIFRQINKDQALTHHDALEFPNGDVILLSHLSARQSATILQLPAEPKTEAEKLEQTRLEVVG
jgi:hypothetical protein